MEKAIKDFNDYKTNKRLEITAMHTIITSLDDSLRPKERRLLIASYIVLAYSYWESCFHKFQKLLFHQQQQVLLKNLPFPLQTSVYLELIKDAAGPSKSKPIKDISCHQVFEKIYTEMHVHDEQTIDDINYVDRVKNLFIDNTQNPKFDSMKKLIARYAHNFDEIFNSSLNEKYFEFGLVFIIRQRNLIAHKNENISYNDFFYDNYDLCYNAFIFFLTNALTTDLPNELPEKIEDFIKEMTYQIDIFFNHFVENTVKRGPDNA